MATIKRATHGDDRPAQVHFQANQPIRLWDAISRQETTKVPSFRISLSMNIDLPMRFAAKAALAAGYYVYGDLFRNHVDHRQLRDVMQTDLAKLDLTTDPVDLGIDHLTLSVDTWMHEEPAAEDRLFALRRFCEAIRGSVVVLMPGPDSLGVGVGLLGRYLAMLNVPATTESFPNDGDYAWGHVLAMVDKRLHRCSLEHGLTQWLRIDQEAISPGPPLPIFKE